jgi:hypothetical protein
MGTNILAPVASAQSLTFAELHDVPGSGCSLRFGRHFFSPMMVSELTRPMTPVNFVQFVDPLLTIDIMVGGMTAAAPMRPSKQTFNVFLVSCADLSFTEVELTPQVPFPRPWIASAVERLNEFQEWQPNWNEAEAPAFSSDTLDTGREVLQNIWNFSVRREIRTKPNIVPLDDGSLRFEWVLGDKELFFTILGKSIEAQRWHPLAAVESQTYGIILPSQVEHELEWLTA